MVSQPIMTSIPKTGTQNIGIGLKNSVLHRNHYSGPSGSGYHQHHHIYHITDSEGYQGGHGFSEHGGGGKKKSIALSALTLLAFLFFLNILQNCIEDQMDDMNPQVMVMTSRLQQNKEAQRLADSKSTNDHSEALKLNGDNLQREIDNLSGSTTFFNNTFKMISNSNKNRKNV